MAENYTAWWEVCVCVSVCVCVWTTAQSRYVKWNGHESDLQSFHTTTVGKLITHMPLSASCINIGQRVVVPCSWEGGYFKRVFHCVLRMATKRDSPVSCCSAWCSPTPPVYFVTAVRRRCCSSHHVVQMWWVIMHHIVTACLCAPDKYLTLIYLLSLTDQCQQSWMCGTTRLWNDLVVCQFRR